MSSISVFVPGTLGIKHVALDFRIPELFWPSFVFKKKPRVRFFSMEAQLEMIKIVLYQSGLRSSPFFLLNNFCFKQCSPILLEKPNNKWMREEEDIV